MYLHPHVCCHPGTGTAWYYRRLDVGPAAQGSGWQAPGVTESLRWIEGYERVAETAATMPDTRLVYVGDRGSILLP